MSSLERKKSSVRAQFTRRAGAYARSESHASDPDLNLLLQHLNLRREDRVLDVATGTGFTATALRPHVASVTGLDLTHRMLLEAVRLTADAARSERGTTRLANFTWVEGDVEELPFRDNAFSVVTCRRAPHHFAGLDRAIDEMLRVLQPGGRIGIVDQINPEESSGRHLMDELEVLRDPSHVHSLTANEWREHLARRAIAVVVQDVVELVQQFDRWLALADTPAYQRDKIDRTLQHAPTDAKRQIGYEDTPHRTFVKRWLVLVGRKP